MSPYLLGPFLSVASLFLATCVAHAETPLTITTTQNRFAVSPTGRQLAVVPKSSPSQVEVWDLSGLKKQHALAADASDEITSCLFSADGAVLAAATKGRKILLWHTSSGAPLATLVATEEQGPVSKFWLSPDGRTVATVGKDSGSLSIWDCEGAKCVTTVRGAGPIAVTDSPQQPLAAVR